MPFTALWKNIGNKEWMVCCEALKSPRTAAASASLGLVLAFWSGVFMSIATVIVKYLTNIHPGQLTLYRFWAVAAIALPQLVSSQKNVLGPPESRISLILFGISSTTTAFLMFLAFRYLPLGEAAVLSSCYPALIIIAGRVFLKESLGLLHIISVAAVILGMILISDFYSIFIEGRISYTAERIYGLSAALGSLFFTASLAILARKLKDVDSAAMLFTCAVIGCLESSILTYLIGDFSLNYRGLQQYLILLLGLVSYLAQFCTIISLRYVDAGPSSTVRAACDIIFSFIWQIIVFGEKPDTFALLGAFFVCIAIALVGFMQHLRPFLPQKCSHLC